MRSGRSCARASQQREGGMRAVLMNAEVEDGRGLLHAMVLTLAIALTITVAVKCNTCVGFTLEL